MSSQHAFAQALLDPHRAIPAGLRCWNGSDPAIRFAVYRNNIVVALVDALADQFPVTAELVGEEFFRAMARVFVQQHPPRSRLIAFVGSPFADFIASFPPAHSVPYLADVARLEMSRIRACHAADIGVLSADAIGSTLSVPEQLSRATFVLHPSVQLLSSPFAIFSLWAAHQGALDITQVDPLIAQQVLIFRDGLNVQSLQITIGAWHFLSTLRTGATLALAAEAAEATVAADAQPDAESQDPFDLAGTIALLLRYPLVTHMEPLP